MKSGKAVRIASGLLAAKGAAAPSSASRENLGPARIGQVIADAIVQRGRKPPDAAACSGRAQARVNLSLRLDRDRHRRLNLASAHLGLPAQSVIVLALDAYLDRIANDLPTASRGRPRKKSVGESARGAATAAGRRNAKEHGS